MGPEYALLAAAAIAAASAAATGYASHQQAKGQEYAADQEADILKYNERVSRAEAGAQEADQRRKAAVLLAEQRGTASARGLSLSGSAWDLYVQSAAEAELDALEIRRQGTLRQQNLSTAANSSRYAAKQYQLGARIGAGATALKVGAEAAGGYANFSAYKASTAPDASQLEVD